MAANRRPMNRTTVNLLLDGVSFIAFLAATAPALTGLAIHEWLSIALAGAVVTHLLLHWSWIIGIAQRFFSKASWNSRVNYILNSLLFITFTVIIFTGVMISEVALPMFGLEFARNDTWMQLHRLSSDATVFLMGLHVALHWRWIVNATRKLFSRPLVHRPQSQVDLIASSTPEVN